MSFYFKGLAVSGLMLMGLLGCATVNHDYAATLKAADRPAWSVKPQEKIQVSVSPARQTLMIAGTTGAIIGAGISAAADAKHQRAVDAVMEGHDPGAEYVALLEGRLQAILGPGLERVEPLDSTTGYQDRKDAIQQRYRSIRGKGHGLLLEVETSYGVFGPQGTLLARIDGELRDLKRGKKLWADTVIASSEDILANDRLTDPTKRMAPNFSSPRLSIEGDAIERWTKDGGEALRTGLHDGMEGAVSGMLMQLGLVTEAPGAFYLGGMALRKKDFEEADAYFKQAIALDPGLTAAHNGLSVAWAHNGQLDAAITLAEEIVAENPEYAPAQFNLAWWYAVEKSDLDAARPHYDRARALGLAGEKKLDKAMGIE